MLLANGLSGSFSGFFKTFFTLLNRHLVSRSLCGTFIATDPGLSEAARLGCRVPNEADRGEEERVPHAAPEERQGEPGRLQRGLHEDAAGRVRTKRQRKHQRYVARDKFVVGKRGHLLPPSCAQSSPKYLHI